MFFVCLFASLKETLWDEKKNLDFDVYRHSNIILPYKYIENMEQIMCTLYTDDRDRQIICAFVLFYICITVKTVVAQITIFKNVQKLLNQMYWENCFSLFCFIQLK